MKILNFSSCNIDYVYSLDHIVVPGETLTTSKMEKFPGSMSPMQYPKQKNRRTEP